MLLFKEKVVRQLKTVPTKKFLLVRKYAGLSTRKFAKFVGCSQSYIVKLESPTPPYISADFRLKFSIAKARLRNIKKEELVNDYGAKNPDMKKLKTLIKMS